MRLDSRTFTGPISEKAGAFPNYQVICIVEQTTMVSSTTGSTARETSRTGATGNSTSAASRAAEITTTGTICTSRSRTSASSGIARSSTSKASKTNVTSGLGPAALVAVVPVPSDSRVDQLADSRADDVYQYIYTGVKTFAASSSKSRGCCARNGYTFFGFLDFWIRVPT